MSVAELDASDSTCGENGDLPAGWALAKAGDVLNLTNGFPFKPSHWKNHGLPIIRIQNLNDSKKTFNYCPENIPAKYLVKRGDLLFAWSGTPGTSFGAHIWTGENAWLNQHIFRVDFDETLFFKPFMRLAINHNLQEYIAKAHGGVGLAHITKGKFEDSYLRIPPLAEQGRIVAAVEALSARVGAARARLERTAALLRRFRQAVLAHATTGHLTAAWRDANPTVETAHDLFERVTGKHPDAWVRDGDDPVTPPEIPESWVWSRCEQLCQHDRAITYGVIKLGPPVEGGIPTLRSSDVRWLSIDPHDVKPISASIASNYSRTFLIGGEIVVTVRGSLGGVAVVPTEMAGYNISREVAMLPLFPDFDAQFFCYAIASLPSQNWLSEVTKGVAYTGVNIRDLKRLPLPLPPLSEQQEIVRRVEALFALADAAERRIAAARARADRLTQSILAQAFRGQLVPTEAHLAREQNRPYESAADLLARTRAEREPKASNGRTKPSRRSRNP